MTKARRVAWVVVALIIVGLIGGGISWHIYQNMGDKLLKRAELALIAKKFDKADSYAGDHISKHPKDWRGYSIRARIYMKQGRFADARAPLADANSLNPGNASLAIAMAQTYSSPALRALGSLGNAENARRIEALRRATEALDKADEILRTFKSPDKKAMLNIAESIAMNHQRKGLALQTMADLLEEDARIAEAARDMDAATKKRDRSRYEQGQARQVFAQAIQELQEVIQKDPTRAQAAETLVNLCLDSLNDNLSQDAPANPGVRVQAKTATDALAAARKAMKDPNTAPPGAVALLATHDLQSFAAAADTKAGRDKIDELRKRLEGVLKANPKSAPIMIALGQVAMARAEFKDANQARLLRDAKRLVDDVIQNEPGNFGARLLRAKVMLSQIEKKNQNAEDAKALYAPVEKDLFTLKSDYPNSSQALYYYAHAAEGAGKTELARDAMRTLIQLEERTLARGKRYRLGQEKHFALARKQFVRQLLQQGFYTQALADAEPLYRNHPQDPEAIALFVQAARDTERTELARQTLNKAWQAALTKAGQADPNRPGEAITPLPVTLMAVAEGFRSLRDANDGKVLDDLLSRDAQAWAENPNKPRSSAEALAVAKALIFKERSAEAEKLLLHEIAKSPDDPKTCFALANLYKATNRDLQAEELCRKAMNLDDQKSSYRLALASMLVSLGDLDDAKGILEPIVESNIQAKLLQMRIKALREEPIDKEVQEFLHRPDAGKRYGAQLAQIYLATNRPEECLITCETGLKINPNDTAFLVPQAGAYQALGKMDDCIETWKKAIGAQPDQLPFYQQIVPWLVFRSDPNASASQPAGSISITPKEFDEKTSQAGAEIMLIPGARQELVDFALANQYERARLYDRAGEMLDKVVANPNKDVSPGIKYRAQLQKAQVLALADKPDDAIKALDGLIAASKGIAKTNAMYAKAKMLAIMQRADAAKEALNDLCQEAGKKENKHHDILHKTAALQLKLGLIEQAEATCDVMKQLFPDSPRNCVMRAEIFLSKGLFGQAAKLYEEAISRQPTNFDLYMKLADILDAQGQRKAALEALERVEDIGLVGMSFGLLHQGNLLSRWGLRAEAVKKLEKLSAMQTRSNPSVQLAMATAFGRLGQKDQAKAAIARISEYSGQYVPAQLMLADLTDGTDAKLAIIRNLAASKPGNEFALIYEMTLLLRDKKPSEALKAFDRHQASAKPDSLPSLKAVPLALNAAIEARNATRMKQLSQTLADRTKAPQWRLAAALLAMDDEPEKAGKALTESSVYPTMLRLCLANRSGDADEARKCAAWLGKTDADLAKRPRPYAIPTNLMFLCGLLAKDDDMTKAALAKLDKGIAATAARELMSNNPGSAGADAVTIKLIKAGIARELRLPQLALTWAMEALKARPTCQWAAMELSFAGPSPEDVKQALGVLRPADCDLARLLDAMILQQDGKYKQAAEIYSALAEKTGDLGPDYLVNQAMALEQSGQLTEALNLYRKILQKHVDPRAANNAACLVMQLSPNDKAKLAEAKKWIDAALKALPAPAIADTAAWLAHLQGRDGDALGLLRRAIRSLPDSPDVHYHLGLVEQTAGDADMGRLHLEAAVNLGKDLKASGKPVPAATAEAINRAAEALVTAKNPK